MTTYSPEVDVRRPAHQLLARCGHRARSNSMAGMGGYAIAGGFTAESSPGQEVSDRVMDAYATGDAASIAATYDPAVKVVLIYDNTEHVIARNTKELTGEITGAIAFGNTYRQIGPVSTYEATRRRPLRRAHRRS